MSDTYRATLEQWAGIADHGWSSMSACVLELRARVEHLERMRETEKAAVLDLYGQIDKLKERVDRHYLRIRALEGEPIQEPAMPGDAPQTLHTIALQMVDTLEQLNVLPEILDTLRRAIREPMEPPAPCPHIRSSDEGTSYCALAEATAKSTSNDRQIRSTAPASSLVKEVTEAIVDGMLHSDQQAACDAIRAVADWLDGREYYGAPALLREEANR